MSRTERTPTQVDDLKLMALRRALNATGWSPTKAAFSLGVSRATVYRWIRKYGVTRDAE